MGQGRASWCLRHKYRAKLKQQLERFSGVTARPWPRPWQLRRPWSVMVIGSTLCVVSLTWIVLKAPHGNRRARLFFWLYHLLVIWTWANSNFLRLNIEDSINSSFLDFFEFVVRIKYKKWNIINFKVHCGSGRSLSFIHLNIYQASTITRY